MFGDVMKQFGFDSVMTSMRQFQEQAAQQQQQPWAAGVDPQGGMFAPTQGAPTAQQMPGMGGGPGRATGAPAMAGGAQGPGMAAPAPTGSAVAQGPALSALSPGSGSPMAPPPGQPTGPIEQGADQAFQRASDVRIPGMGGTQQQRRPSDFASFGELLR
jgi:hypothetical protein